MMSLDVIEDSQMEMKYTRDPVDQLQVLWRLTLVDSEMILVNQPIPSYIKVKQSV